jgi:anti-sigma factor RsiW
MSWWRRKPEPLSCKEVVELVSDFIDGALPPGLRVRMEAHLTGCDPCIEYVGQIRATVALAAQTTPDPIDPATSSNLIDLYRTWQRPPTDPPG